MGGELPTDHHLRTLDWKPDQVAEHLSPILDAKVRESRLRGELEIAECLEFFKKCLSTVPAISDMHASARGLTTQKYLSGTLIKDVPELKSLKYARVQKKVEVAGVKRSPHDFSEPLLTWCVGS